MDRVDKNITDVDVAASEGQNGKRKAIIAAIAVAGIAVIGVVAFLLFGNGNDTKANTMRLLRTVGDVKLEVNGQLKTLMENMRLGDGNAIVTGDKSLASVSLDDTKVISVEENSRAEFHKSGKKLELILTAGTMFFDVREHMDVTESLDLKVSTMIVGVRGTSGYLWIDPATGKEYFILTSGTVKVKGRNPYTNEEIVTELGPGDMITTYLYNDAGSTGSISFEKKKIEKPQDLPVALLRELANNEDTFNRFLEENNFNRDEVIEIIEQSKEDDYITLPEGDDLNTPVITPTPEPTPAPEEEATGTPELIFEEVAPDKINIIEGGDGEPIDDSNLNITVIPGTNIEVDVEANNNLPAIVVKPVNEAEVTPSPTSTPTPAPTPTTPPTEGDADVTPTPAPTTSPEVTPSPTAAPITSCSMDKGGSGEVTVGDRNVTFSYPSSNVGSGASLEKSGDSYVVNVNYADSIPYSKMLAVTLSGTNTPTTYYGGGNGTYAVKIPESDISNDNVTITTQIISGTQRLDIGSTMLVNNGSSSDPSKNIKLHVKDSSYRDFLPANILVYDGGTSSGINIIPESGSSANWIVKMYTSASATSPALTGIANSTDGIYFTSASMTAGEYWIEIGSKANSCSISKGGSGVVTVGDTDVTFSYPSTNAGTGASVERSGYDNYIVKVNYSGTVSYSNYLGITLSGTDMPTTYFWNNNSTDGQYAVKIPADKISGNSVSISVSDGIDHADVTIATGGTFGLNLGDPSNPGENVIFHSKSDSSYLPARVQFVDIFNALSIEPTLVPYGTQAFVGLYSSDDSTAPAARQLYTGGQATGVTFLKSVFTANEYWVGITSDPEWEYLAASAGSTVLTFDTVDTSDDITITNKAGNYIKVKYENDTIYIQNDTTATSGKYKFTASKDSAGTNIIREFTCFDPQYVVELTSDDLVDVNNIYVDFSLTDESAATVNRNTSQTLLFPIEQNFDVEFSFNYCMLCDGKVSNFEIQPTTLDGSNVLKVTVNLSEAVSSEGGTLYYHNSPSSIQGGSYVQATPTDDSNTTLVAYINSSTLNQNYYVDPNIYLTFNATGESWTIPHNGSANVTFAGHSFGVTNDSDFDYVLEHSTGDTYILSMDYYYTFTDNSFLRVSTSNAEPGYQYFAKRTGNDTRYKIELGDEAYSNGITINIPGTSYYHDTWLSPGNVLYINLDDNNDVYKMKKFSRIDSVTHNLYFESIDSAYICLKDMSSNDAHNYALDIYTDGGTEPVVSCAYEESGECFNIPISNISSASTVEMSLRALQ